MARIPPVDESSAPPASRELAAAHLASGSRMTNINKGIINTGSIGGNASVTVTDYGSGNVIAPGWYMMGAVTVALVGALLLPEPPRKDRSGSRVIT